MANSIPGPTLEQMRRAPTHPGVILVEWLDALGLTRAEAARRLCVDRLRLNHVCVGRRPMSHALCVKVAKLLGTSAEMWARLQMSHDLWHAMHDPAAKKAAKAIASVRKPAVGPEAG